MKIVQRILGLLISIISSIALYLIAAFPMLVVDTEFFTILFSYLLTLFMPGLIIDLVFGWLGRGLEE